MGSEQDGEGCEFENFTSVRPGETAVRLTRVERSGAGIAQRQLAEHGKHDAEFEQSPVSDEEVRWVACLDSGVCASTGRRRARARFARSVGMEGDDHRVQGT